MLRNLARHHCWQRNKLRANYPHFSEWNGATPTSSFVLTPVSFGFFRLFSILAFRVFHCDCFISIFFHIRLYVRRSFFFLQLRGQPSMGIDRNVQVLNSRLLAVFYVFPHWRKLRCTLRLLLHFLRTRHRCALRSRDMWLPRGISVCPPHVRHRWSHDGAWRPVSGHG